MLEDAVLDAGALPEALDVAVELLPTLGELPPELQPTSSANGTRAAAILDEGRTGTPDWDADVFRSNNKTTPTRRRVRVVLWESDQASAESSSIKLRVRDASTGMPGPIVVVIVALLM